MDRKPKPFKQVNIERNDWDEYKQLADLLRQQRGYRVSLPMLIRESVTLYRDNIVRQITK